MSMQLFSVAGRTAIGALRLTDWTIEGAQNVAKGGVDLSYVFCMGTAAMRDEADAKDIKARKEYEADMDEAQLAELNARRALRSLPDK